MGKPQIPMALSLYHFFSCFFLSFDGHNWGYIPFSDTPNALNQPMTHSPKRKKLKARADECLAVLQPSISGAQPSGGTVVATDFGFAITFPIPLIPLR